MQWTSLTRRQGGLVLRSQLIACGLGRHQIEQLRHRGRLENTRAAALYRAAGAPFAIDTPAWFAVLASRSPLSYSSAAQWWEVPVEPDGLVHVTRPERRRLDWPDGVRVHRVGLSNAEVTRHRGLLVTTRVETLLDCLGWLPYSAAGALADRAEQQRWLTAGDVERRLEAQPGRWGNKQLRRLVGQFGDGAAAESERLLHRLLRQAGLTGWSPNIPLKINGCRFVVDVAFADQRVAIEVDGRRYHSTDRRFQADRTKQNALISSGWRVLRFTWADLVERPAYVVNQIISVLAAYLYGVGRIRQSRTRGGCCRARRVRPGRPPAPRRAWRGSAPA